MTLGYLVRNDALISFSFLFFQEDIAISFSKKRYRATVHVTAQPDTSIVTVRANAGNFQSPVHYSVVSVNGKPYNEKTSLFEMDPVTGTVLSFDRTYFIPYKR